MWKLSLLITILLCAVQTKALESSDRLSTQIIKVYEKNVLVINRGLEDAIFKADHGKLTSDDGFIARGICIKATLLTSHWKIYRVVRPQLISKDTEYTLSSINQSQIPGPLIKFSTVDFSDWYLDTNDETRKKEVELQQKRVASYDLPDGVKNTASTREMETTNFDKFVQKNFNDDLIKNDLQSFYFNFFASPLSFETRFDQKEIHYGFHLYNLGEKYRFELKSLETQSKIVDPVSRQTFASKSTHHNVRFELYKLASFLSVFSFLEYKREKIGNNYYPYDHYKVGVLALKFHLWDKNTKFDFIDLSYAPVFDNIKFTNPDKDTDLLERDGIRHHFKLRISRSLNENLSNRTELTYSPLTELSSSNFDFEDTYVHGESTFAYKLSDKFYWDYILEYERDNLRDKVYNVTADNTIQTFRFRYEVPL